MNYHIATIVLRNLAFRGLITTSGTTFHYRSTELTNKEICEMFTSVSEKAGYKPPIWSLARGNGVDFYCRPQLFEKLFNLLFVSQKIFPKNEDNEPLVSDNVPMLPTLFIGAEKTQFRQIPLVEEPPWPFKFLLELGGMIVCRPSNARGFLKELRQFLNNHPRYRIKVHADQWKTGEVVVVTTYLRVLTQNEGKRNLNVAG